VLFNFIAVFTYVSFHLAAPPYNLTPAGLGLIFVVYLLGTATTPLVGRAVARFGRRHFVIAMLALWAAGLALTLLPSLIAIIAGLAVAAACGFFCQASSQSFVATTARHGISSAIGLYVTAFYIGGSVGAFLPGLAWDAGGWSGTVAMVLVIQAIMAVIVWLAWTRDGK